MTSPGIAYEFKAKKREDNNQQSTTFFIMEAVTQKQITVEQQTAIDNQLSAYKEEALLEMRASRPKNTRIAYEKKQAEWMVSS